MSAGPSILSKLRRPAPMPVTQPSHRPTPQRATVGGGRWAQVTVVASVAVLATAGLVALKPGRGGRGAAADAGSCTEVPVPTVMPDGEPALVQVSVAPELRLFIDHVPARGAVSLTPTVHVVDVETVDGEAQHALKLQFEALRPAVLLAEYHSKVGASLVFLGASCLNCPGSAEPVVLTPTPGATGTLAGAAAALHSGDWPTAAEQLRGLKKSERAGPAYASLAAAVLTSAGDEAKARALLSAQPNKPVRELLALEADARRAAQAQVLQRWNTLTERFSRLTLAAGERANAPVAAASTRFAELSHGFNEALKVSDLSAELAIVRTGDETLRVFWKAVRASRPGDCEFQAQLGQGLN